MTGRREYSSAAEAMATGKGETRREQQFVSTLIDHALDLADRDAPCRP